MSLFAKIIFFTTLEVYLLFRLRAYFRKYIYDAIANAVYVWKYKLLF